MVSNRNERITGEWKRGSIIQKRHKYTRNSRCEICEICSTVLHMCGLVVGFSINAWMCDLQKKQTYCMKDSWQKPSVCWRTHGANQEKASRN